MRVVSGIQPTGNLHLGNYLGAIREWVRMQDDGECLFFLADSHAITVHQDPRSLAAATREMAAALIASGVDPARSVLFNQSRVPEHTELAWVLNCTARMGWLNRMTQFKEKSGKDREGSSVGLFTYPVLQAADVLLYDATHVPVGEDQKQHLELARDIATKFNNDFGVDLFVPPEPKVTAAAPRVRSLRDGAAKMSKSDPSDASRVNLTDDADAIAQKIRRARTDAEPLPESMDGLEGRAEARNLLEIFAALEGATPQAVLDRFAGQGFGVFKPALADVVVAALAPIGARMRELLGDPCAIDAALTEGADRARGIATPKMARVRETLGFLG